MGGGCALLIRDHIPHARCFNFNSTPNIQVVECDIHVRVVMKMVCVYRSPSASTTEDGSFLTELAHTLLGNRWWTLMGDFNAPAIDWRTEVALNSSFFENELLKTIHELAAHQHVKEFTRFREQCRPSLLDLLITQYESDLHEVKIGAPIGKSDHATIHARFLLSRNKPPQKWIRLYNRVDGASIISHARALNWTGLGVESMWATFRYNLEQLELAHVPLKRLKSNSSRPWYRTKERKWSTKKRQAWTRYKANPNDRQLRRYKRVRNHANKVCAAAKQKFELGIARRISVNPKCFYSYVQSHTRLRQQVAYKMATSAGEITGDIAIAEHFKDYFTSVFRKDRLNNPNTADLPVTSRRMPDVTIRTDDTSKQLKRLCSSKSPGPDGIHPAMLRLVSDAIAEPLTDIFNRSLEESYVPTDWKTAIVVPIHKARETNLAGNYRPVSLTSVPSKILERILREKIADYLLAEGLLNPAQHGFIQGRSCLTNLLLALDKITDALDKGHSVHIGFLDFEKAFDSVNHRLLIQKMRAYGIASNICSWTEEFLKERKFSVRVREANSSAAIAPSGVPQGTVLGPILFLIYVNDLPVRLDSLCFLFADDVKVISTLAHGSQLQRDLDTISEWSERWDLPLNPAKCVTLSTSQSNGDIILGGHMLHEAETVKDLGVTLNKTFTPSAQCAAAACKARKVLFLLKGAIKSRAPEVWIPLYCAYVRPHLEYCVQAWSPYLKKDIAVLENVQRMATRWVHHMKGIPYTERLKHLGLFSLERRRLRGDLIEVYKITNGNKNVPCSEILRLRNGRDLRGHSRTLDKLRCNHRMRSSFFSQRVVNPWNKLSEEIVSAPSLEVFKKQLDRHWETYFPELI